MSWRNRPTYKEQWPEAIDFMVFIDENGDSSIKGVMKNLKKNIPVEQNNRYFTITACVISRDTFPKIRQANINLKEKHWKNGLYNYNKKKLKRVCFHSHEIRTKTDPFSDKVINYSMFLGDLNKYIYNLNIKIFSSTLDKKRHCERYKEPMNPYNLCINFILERLVKFYLKENQTAIIVLEARGTREDKKLLTHIKSVIDNGTSYANKKYFEKIKGVYFNPKWCKKQNELKTYFCLEIADLISYPIHKYNTRNVKDKAFKLIENKIYEYPNYDGKGIKFFPHK